MQVIKRQILREQIKKILTDSILRGELQPGNRIIETKIARDLSVSQAPVREAILELEQIGLIKIKPYKGAFVNKPTKRDLYEAYTVRALLEGEAGREAAKFVDSKLLAELKKLLQHMKEAAELGDTGEFVQNDVKFHACIIQAAGNKLLLKLWKQIRMSDLTYVTTILTKRELRELAERHNLIYEKLQTRDSKEVERHMRSHINELLEDIIKNIEE